MRSSFLIGAVVASILVAPAIAQQPNASNLPSTQEATPATLHKSGQWRASQLIGLYVYDDRTEKIGAIKDLLVDDSGKITSAVIGVGGFLGVGERNILVSMDKLKFSNEPRREAAEYKAGETTGSGGRPAEPSAASTARIDADRWFPDHAVVSGVTRESAKSMPEFRYD